MKFNKKLSDIIGIRKIEDVKKPIEKAHGLPNECYLSVDYLEFEKEKIFRNIWTQPAAGDAGGALGAALAYWYTDLNNSRLETSYRRNKYDRRRMAMWYKVCKCGKIN